MKLKAIVELWDNGVYSIYVPDTKGHNLNAQGASVAEAKDRLAEAIDDYTKMYRDAGKAIPKEIDQPVFEYQYDIASFFDYFDLINISKLAKLSGINPSLMRQYKSRSAFASEKQSQKIQDAINKLGEELMAVRL
ncbi:MAG: type II toxin-antitoxin system HicB family antitoxin [Tannerellaceae bacterium]|jgi:predicted RNase H-like HicB family nuclease|nr:type II toxin-antitoxin system HicB family antitoxin [Tannerellaceae bacterium]